MAAVVELRQLMDSNLESSASIAGDVSSVGSLVLRVLQAVSSLVNPPKPKSVNNVSCLPGQNLACATCLSVSKAPNMVWAVKRQCPRLASSSWGPPTTGLSLLHVSFQLPDVFLFIHHLSLRHQ